MSEQNAIVLQRPVNHIRKHNLREPAYRISYGFGLYTMLTITLMAPTISILLMLKLIIDPALTEPVGFTWLPDGASTPPVVAAVGGRAVEVAGALAGESTPPVGAAGARAGVDESTELAGAILVAAGLGDEVAVVAGAAAGLATGVATGAPAPPGVATGAPVPPEDTLHWERSGVETWQAPGRVTALVWLRGRGMLLTGKPRRLLDVLPVNSGQRQMALLLATSVTALQQLCVGGATLVEGPLDPTKKLKHGDKDARAELQDDEELGEGAD